MAELSTKERILNAALELFSSYGYQAVSVGQIASAVGIQAPSLYKHYKSKQDIFDAMFLKMQQRYDEQNEKMQLHFEDASSDTDRYAHTDADELVRQVGELFCYSLHDGYVSRFRRLMTIEQFRSPELSRLYNERYVDRTLNYHENLFRELIGRGTLIKGDARSMAMQYVCPILIMLAVCDREPDKEEWALAQLEANIRQFTATYGVQDNCNNKGEEK